MLPLFCLSAYYEESNGYEGAGVAMLLYLFVSGEYPLRYTVQGHSG